MNSLDPIRDFCTFLLGAVVLSMGAFLFFNQVMASLEPMGRCHRFGQGFGPSWEGSLGMPQALGNSFGLLLIPWVIGDCLLFALRNQPWGWFLVQASVAALAVGVLQTLSMRFQPTTLWSVLAMMAVNGSSGGLMFRSLRGYDDGKEAKDC